MKFRSSILILLVGISSGCAHKAPVSISEQEAARLDRNLVREAVVFEPGAETNAIVPDVSAPRLRAVFVKGHREGTNRYTESRREWLFEGDVVLLGIPDSAVTAPTGTTLPKGGIRYAN